MVFTFDLPCPELFFSHGDDFDFQCEDRCCVSTVWFSFSQKVCANEQWVLFFISRKDVWNEFCGDTPQARNFQSKL